MLRLLLAALALVPATCDTQAERTSRITPLHHDAWFQTVGAEYVGTLQQLTHPDTLWVGPNGSVTTGPARARASRLASTATFDAPYTMGGSIVVHDRMDKVVYKNGFVPGWDWRVTFFPIFHDSNNLVAVMIGGDGTIADRFAVTMKIDGEYTGCWNREIHHPAKLAYGREHTYEFRVPRWGRVEVTWDGVRVATFTECDGASHIGPAHVGYRMDFHHVTLRNSYVEERFE